MSVAYQRASGTRGLAWRRDVEGYLFALPFLLGLVLFKIGPMFASFYFSLTNWDLFTSPRFIGLGNYVTLLTNDNLFWQSLRITAVYVFGRLSLLLVVSLALALLLNQRMPARGLFRTLFYLPVVTPVVASALLWGLMFSPRFGAINGLLAAVGIPGPGWIASTDWVLPALMIVSVWESAGAMMIIFLAGLQGVPLSLYEAAKIDGANALQRFWSVTIPIITPVIFFNLVTGIVGSFQVFTTVYVMTEGGPANASLVYMLYLYRNAFQFLNMGYASALAWLLFVILGTITLLLFKSSNWVHYESTGR